MWHIVWCDPSCEGMHLHQVTWCIIWCSASFSVMNDVMWCIMWCIVSCDVMHHVKWCDLRHHSIQWIKWWIMWFNASCNVLPDEMWCIMSQDEPCSDFTRIWLYSTQLSLLGNSHRMLFALLLYLIRFSHAHHITEFTQWRYIFHSTFSLAVPHPCLPGYTCLSHRHHISDYPRTF